jgi:hypothetical protein
MFEETLFDSFGVCGRELVTEAPGAGAWRLEAMQPGPFGRAVEVWQMGDLTALVYPV